MSAGMSLGFNALESAHHGMQHVGNFSTNRELRGETTYMLYEAIAFQPKAVSGVGTHHADRCVADKTPHKSL